MNRSPSIPHIIGFIATVKFKTEKMQLIRESLNFVLQEEPIESKIRRLESELQNLNLKIDKNQSTKEYLTREETAKLCGVKSLTTLHNWKVKGILVPTGKAGRKPLYKRLDVIDYIEQKEGKN
ncbi:hypothetical protein VOI54_00745 [Tamlana sp. 2201CG12-4]|uniref:hypothetical protein n=1 Tax=Tamlana sp. 2201CG12-4 TaxID=3112582 RepID=UPI002DBEB064|nr:hypothetical protein [Tamlana sp. 2201CG12-4]MEC3905535.1 hypothetical protein [Tamlana sp. 2201CG12-4]